MTIMELPSYFSDFLAAIRPTTEQKDDYKAAHKKLRERLNEDEKLSPIIVSDFLQGSYRRATSVRPVGKKRPDVDVIVVTNLDRSEQPKKAMDRFVPFLDKHYKGKYHFQTRSIALESAEVDLDLVITAAPSEADKDILKAAAVRSEDTPEDTSDWRLVESWISLEERSGPLSDRILKAAAQEPEWKASPLLIPDRETKSWEETHPLAQIRWTWKKNNDCNGHYVNIVKAVKWSHRFRQKDAKYPKGYPLEHMIGVCCPDNTNSVAEGVTSTLKKIVEAFASDVAANKTPWLSDHGVPSHNVLHRLSVEDFKAFYQYCLDAAKIAQRALDATTIVESANAWRELFGEEFPPPPPDKNGDGGPNKGGFTERSTVSSIGGGRFADNEGTQRKVAGWTESTRRHSTAPDSARLGMG
jgi:Second Messenger Oligonucleotide or Dinucleotide Synthetase domain